MEWALAIILKHKYLALLPLGMLEGPLIALVAGFLTHTGVLHFWVAYPILILGDLIPDIFFYSLGYFSDRLHIVNKHLSGPKINKLKNLWKHHGRTTMFFGKLAYGMGLPFLASAGVVKMPFGKFLEYAVPVTLLQYGLLMIIGYIAGNTYSAAKEYVDITYFAMAGFVIAFIIIHIIFAKYARHKINVMEKQERNDKL